MKGWYIPTHPQEEHGETTAWYASFWDFCAAYLTERFGNDWCLTAQQSLALYTDDWMVPRQLIVHSPKGNNNIIQLRHGTELVDSKSSEKSFPGTKDRHTLEGLQLYSLEAALIACPPSSFSQSPALLRSALATITDVSELLSRLLDSGHSTIAGRLAGAFRNINYDRIADTILEAMEKAGYHIRELDPFEDEPPKMELWTPSPSVNRMKLLPSGFYHTCPVKDGYNGNPWQNSYSNIHIQASSSRHRAATQATVPGSAPHVEQERSSTQTMGVLYSFFCGVTL